MQAHEQWFAAAGQPHLNTDNDAYLRRRQHELDTMAIDYRLLLVDDDDVDRERVVRLLARSGLTVSVDEASTAEQALTLVGQVPYACVLLDYQLPDATGVELIPLLKQRARPAELPVIMLTGMGDTSIAVTAMKLGAQDYLAKDRLQPDTLRAAIEGGFARAALRKAEQALQDSEERLRAVVDAAVDAIVVIDETGVIESINPATESMFGYASSDLLGSNITTLTPSPHYDGLLAPASTEGKSHIDIEREVIARRRDGTTFPIEVSWSETWISARRKFTGILRDVTVRKEAEEALFQEKELAQITLASIGDAVITTNADGRVNYVNPVAERLTGWPMDEAKGLPLEQVFRTVHQHSRQPLDTPVARVLVHGQTVDPVGDTLLLSRDGTEYAIEDCAAPILTRDKHTAGVVLVFRDVSAAREMASQISYQAAHDALTGLPNRREFECKAHELLSSARSGALQHALMYLDLDHFKAVNDTCGHLAGDELLRQLANLFQDQLRKSDMLARLGGDEFGVLLEACPPDVALRIANSIVEATRNFRFSWNGKLFIVGTSIGLVAITANSEDLKQVLSAADTACYLAKQHGRGQTQVFCSDAQEVMHRTGQLNWLTRITLALEEDRFVLYRQRIVSVDATHHRRVEYYEILLRLRDEENKLVNPTAFIPAAERYNLMPAVDRWVVRKLFQSHGEHLRRAHARRPGSCQYSINLSGTSINDPDCLAFIVEQFRETGVPPETICFEITETAAIANLGRASNFVRVLRGMGCHFALDDFGAGLSSFTYLKNLPVDYLKIDGSIVKQIADDPISRVMVESIQRIGRVMGIQTIAEFVETDAIVRRLCEIGVDYAQGYCIHQPEPLPVPVSVECKQRPLVTAGSLVMLH